MKTLFTLLLATIFSSAAFAYEGGKLTISIAGNRNFQVYVDGRAYQDQDNTYTRELVNFFDLLTLNIRP